MFTTLMASSNHLFISIFVIMAGLVLRTLVLMKTIVLNFSHAGSADSTELYFKMSEWFPEVLVKTRRVYVWKQNKKYKNSSFSSL